jgi:hypothetical protein
VRWSDDQPISHGMSAGKRSGSNFGVHAADPDLKPGLWDVTITHTQSGQAVREDAGKPIAVTVKSCRLLRSLRRPLSPKSD